MKGFHFVLIGAVVGGSALAADKYVTTMTGDGGTSAHSFTYTRPQLSTAAIQCATPSCYKTGTSTPLAVNCAQDPILPGNNRVNAAFDVLSAPQEIQMGADSYVAVKTVDGGEPSCTLYNRTKNP